MDDYQLLGAYLKERREEHQVSLDNMAQRTKLSARKLTELEEGFINGSLPSNHLLKAYIRNYLSSLNESPLHALNLLPRSKEELDQIAPKTLEKKPISPGMIALIFIIFIASIAGILKYITQLNRTNYQIETYSQQTAPPKTQNEALRKEKSSNTPPVNVVTEKEVKKEENDPIEVSFETKSQPKEKTTITQEESQKAIEEEKEETSIKEVIAPTKTPLFSQFSKLKEKIKTSISTEKESSDSIPVEALNVSNTAKANIYVYAYDGDSYLRYKIDSQKVQTIHLTQFQEVSLKGDVIYLWANNRKHLKVYLNGKKWEEANSLKVIQAIFPSGNLIDNQELFKRQGRYRWQLNSPIGNDNNSR